MLLTEVTRKESVDTVVIVICSSLYICTYFVLYIHFLFLEYVEPFLSELSIFSNFSVKSQWLYLLPLDVNPKRVPDSSPLGRHFALSEDVLPQLITPLEKKLGACYYYSYFHFPMKNKKIKLTTFITFL